MTTPRQMRADARRNYERIVETARTAFLDQGPEAPLDDIARRAGVGAGTLYRHFPCREALMEAVYSEDIRRVSDLAYQLLEDHPPGEAIRLWMREQVGFAIQKRGLAATLKAAMDRDTTVFTMCKQILQEAAATLLKAAQESGDVRAELEARDLLLLAHGVAASAEANPEAAERLITVMIDGLKPPA
jgi:AcrR family transcriptional regulator